MKDKIVEKSISRFVEFDKYHSIAGKLRYRSRVGIKKYGATLEEGIKDVQEGLNHLYEEQLDSLNYIEYCISKELPSHINAAVLRGIHGNTIMNIAKLKEMIDGCKKEK